MNLQVLPVQLAVIKINPSEKIPDWVYQNKAFVSVTFTEEELSIVCDQKSIPENVDAIIEKDWSCIKVVGELDFSLTGILSSLANTLANAKVSIFALSTYNTDYLLVKTDALEEAVSALKQNGHYIEE